MEREYLSSLADRLTLETWGAIVDRAIEQAKQGDHRAREWLSEYLLGTEPMSLTSLAVREMAELTVEAELEAQRRTSLFTLPNGKAVLVGTQVEAEADLNRGQRLGKL